METEWKLLTRVIQTSTGKEISATYSKNISMNPYIEYRMLIEDGKYTIREHYGEIIQQGRLGESGVPVSLSRRRSWVQIP